MTKFAITILLTIPIWLSGCFFARVDYETCGTRVSGTLWTIGKRITVDPNGYSSDNDSINLNYPPLFIDTGPRERDNSNFWDE